MTFDRHSIVLQRAMLALRWTGHRVRIQQVRWWVAALAVAAALVMGYGIAEWNFAHACGDAIVTATRFEDGMDPFIAHPDDGAMRSRLVDLRAEYGRELAGCRGSFFIR